MRYHNITTSDMLNGDGLRVVLWLAGCDHHCSGCQNPITWDPDGGLIFDRMAEHELISKLYPKHISGITFSGGDPLNSANLTGVHYLCKLVRKIYPEKTIWLYTGYTWEEIMENRILQEVVGFVDILVDGRFEKGKADVRYPWAGSTNQRVIDVQRSLRVGEIMLYTSR